MPLSLVLRLNSSLWFCLSLAASRDYWLARDEHSPLVLICFPSVFIAPSWTLGRGIGQIILVDLWWEPRFSWLQFRTYCSGLTAIITVMMTTCIITTDVIIPQSPLLLLKRQCARHCAKPLKYIIIHSIFTQHPEEVESFSTSSWWWSVLRASHPQTHAFYWPLSSSDQKPRHPDFLEQQQTNCCMSVFLFPKLWSAPKQFSYNLQHVWQENTLLLPNPNV